jgi:hypothetical protein
MSSRSVRANGFLAAAASLAIVWFASAQERNLRPLTHYLRFTDRNYVELAGTKGLVDLNKSYTIEAWVRWDTEYTGVYYLMGDEAWVGMSRELPIGNSCGWVLRTTALVDLEKRGLEFSIATASGQPEWASELDPKNWTVD